MPDSDTWDLDDGSEYSRDKFYTGSKDGGKDSQTVYVNVPRALWAEVDSWVQGGKVGAYKTRQDFIRDAMFHRAHDIKSILNDPAGSRALLNLLASAELERRIAEMTERSATLIRYQEALDMAMKDGDMTNYQEILTDACSKVEAWPECGARGQLVALIERYERLYRQFHSA